MGGKQNRTRNNVRPSNSGRSAAMLHSTLPQFSGFSGGNKTSGLPSFAFSTVEEFDSSIDDNFQLVLKKVSKKDSTTKLKGLQEFADLLQKAEQPVVKSLLPIWPRFYSVLVIHPDNRIREATQNVHHIIVQKVKRDIAPYLKQLMAPWYTSQYDNYPPAAIAAIQAFKVTFTPLKFKEAVNFCHCEILTYIHDNLLIQTAQTIATQQLSSQEAEARYERVVISCLQGYSMYLKEVSTEKITESASLNAQIVSNKKFWKLATSQIPLIRSSWFQVLSVILQEAVHLLKSKEAQCLTTILNDLEDGESTVLPHVWECLLLATAMPEWWKYINIDQHFIPKILTVLKHAGHGNATVIYPNFLPLLSNMPTMEEKKKKQFYTNFFENMCLGVKLKSVASSTQETKAISMAYIECLQFLITRNVSNTLLCKNLVGKQFCGLIEWCFTKEAVSYKAIFSQSLKFILYLRKNSTLEDIRLLIEYFFSTLYDIFHRTINLPANVQYIGLVTGKQVELLLSLKKIPAVEDNLPANTDDCYLKMIDDFGVRIFKIYLNYIEQASSNELFGQLYILIDGFDKHVLLGNLLEQLKEGNAAPRYMDIYRKWFKKWLFSDQMYCESVLDIIFLIVAEVDDEEKKLILNDLLEVPIKSNNLDCITWAISKTLCRPHVDDPIVQNWLKGKTIGELFVAIAEKYITNEGSPESANILKSALSGTSSGDLLINQDVLNEIVEKLSLIIIKEPAEKPSMDLSCSLAAHICKVIYTQTHRLTYRDELLLALFHLSCRVEGENNFISQDTVGEVNSVWKKSLLILLQNLNSDDSQTLIAKFFKLVEDNFRKTLISRRRRYAVHLSKIVTEIVDTVYKGRTYLLTWLVEFLFSKSMIIRENLVGHCKVAEYVKGTLDSPYDEINFQKSLDEEQILSYFIYTFLYLQVLNVPINNEDKEEDENSSEDDSSGMKVFNVGENPAVDFLEALYSYTITDSFLIHFHNVKHHNELLYYHNLCEQMIRNIFTNITKHTLIQLKILLRDNCLKQAWFWCRTEYVFYTKFIKTVDIRSVYNEILCSAANSDLLSVLHVKQVFNDSELKSDDEMASLFVKIENHRNENRTQFLFEHSDMSWQEINKVIKSVKHCTTLMETSALSQRKWDLIVLSMVSWVSNCLKNKRLINQYQYQSMLVSVINLYTVTCAKVAKLKIEPTDTSFANEWDDLLFEIIHGEVAQIWIFLADHFSNYTEDSLLNLPILQSFGKVTDFLRYDLIFKGSDNLPKWTKFLKISSSSLLTNSQAILQLWGYKMLLLLVPGLVTIDDEAVNTTTPHKNGLIFEQFKEKLIEVQDIVNSVLLDFRIGENSCKVEPSYDSFTYTFAYLLLWDVMINLCEKASSELRYQYSDWLKNGSLFHQFLSILFKLMPTEVLEQDEGKLRFSSESFLRSPVDSSCYSNFCGNNVIENLACYLYKSSLEQFPALVRQWWTVLDIKTSQIVEKITVLYVSPHICAAELNNVLQHQNIFKNLKVKVMASVREIQAIYTVDETQMELAITLPSNYPLGSPNILCNRQISGTSQKQWLLQFKKCVLHQNGKIWDGLYLWNSNLDRKFDGVEECYICYSVLHSGTYQLPKLSCRTCKKKFHSACLYKWFSTSNKSSCPICRNLF